MRLDIVQQRLRHSRVKSWGELTFDLGVVNRSVLRALDGQLHSVPRQQHLVGLGVLGGEEE